MTDITVHKSHTSLAATVQMMAHKITKQAKVNSVFHKKTTQN